jgi:hypothetical protein
MPAEQSRLDEVERVRLPSRVLSETWKFLRDVGEHGQEGLVLWVGDLIDRVALVRGWVTPPQDPISSEDGVGYFVRPEALLQLNIVLSEKELRLVAQVHSHPGEAYHSTTDDRYAIVTAEGGLSLVVPDFANGPCAVENCAVYRLCDTRWTSLSPTEIASLFVIEG